MRRATAAAVAVAIAVATAMMPLRSGRADEPQRVTSEDDVARAKKLFDEATDALQAGRFSDAVKALRTSLELAPRAATAFNLAVALRGTGDALGAAALFDRLAAGDFGEIEPAKRGQVASLSGQVAAEIATLTIGVRGADSVEVRVDGRLVRVAHDGERVTLPVNPGTHHVIASARDRETLDRAIDVARGARLDVELALRAQRDERPGHVVLTCTDATATISIDGAGAAHGRLEADLPPGEYKVRVKNGAGERAIKLVVPAGRAVKLELDAPTTSIVQRPWFWIGAGVLVAGGVAAVVIATRPREGQPVSDAYWGVTSAAFGF